MRIKECQDTIDAGGLFELSFHTSEIKPIYLKIDNVVSPLYVKPDYEYNVTFPEIDKDLDRHNDTELNVSLGLTSMDPAELNLLVYDYTEQMNRLFIPDNGAFISRASMFRLADSLKKICDVRYAALNDEYFKNYILYSIASINASVSRGENYLINGFIVGKPVHYHHYEYMHFFRACFSGYLNSVAPQHKGQSLYNIINSKSSYALLHDFLKDDKFLRNDSLKELVILSNLWDLYFNPDFNQDAIESIVSQINLKTTNGEHKRISASMLSYFNKMQAGSMAPDFSARSRDNKMASLGAFKGRWIYLNFFSTDNIESLKEMPKIAGLKKKYGDKVTFISVCLDDSLASYKNYLRANPKFDWQIWYGNAKGLSKTAKDVYFVTGTEAYFLISNLGYLAQSPALSPSQGIEYRFNIIFKIRQRTTKTGIR